jgi:hypothetical protein
MRRCATRETDRNLWGTAVSQVTISEERSGCTEKSIAERFSR